jgi:hypothetical protein
VYERSRYESLAPLHYVDAGDQRRSGYRLKARVSSVPTFILVDRNGREVARLNGFPGPMAQFEPHLDRMLARLPADNAQ